MPPVVVRVAAAAAGTAEQVAEAASRRGMRPRAWAETVAEPIERPPEGFPENYFESKESQVPTTFSYLGKLKMRNLRNDKGKKENRIIFGLLHICMIDTLQIFDCSKITPLCFSQKCNIYPERLLLIGNRRGRWRLYAWKGLCLWLWLIELIGLIGGRCIRRS